MFNDKLHIFTHKNTIYQSNLKLLAIFGQDRFSSTVRFSDKTFSSTNRFRACAVHHTEVELSWLTWIRVAQTQITFEHGFPQIFRECHFFGVFGCFKWIFTHICSSLGEKFQFKKSDTVTLIQTVFSLWLIHTKQLCHFLRNHFRRWVPLVQYEHLTLPGRLISAMMFSGARVAQLFIFCVVFFWTIVLLVVLFCGPLYCLSIFDIHGF